jgi:hypothetical protein
MPYLGTIPNPTGFLTVSAKANSACVTSSAAFDQANNAVFKTGNTMTGNLVMSGANIAFVSSTNSGIYWGNTGLSFIHSPAANTLVFGTSGAEDMRLDSSGNLGIGNTSPSTSLHISAVSPAITLHSTLSSRKAEIGLLDSYNTYINGPNGGWLILNSQTGVTLFRNNGNEIARFEGNNLGIGTSYPQSPLQVIGAGRFGSSNSQSTGCLAIYNDGNNATIEVFAGNDTATKRNLLLSTYGGNVGIGTTDPQARLHIAGNQAITGIIYNPAAGNTSQLVLSSDTTAATSTSCIALWGQSNATYPGDVHIISRGSGGTKFYNYNGSSWSEHMRLTSDGNVGIGTSVPGTLFQVGNAYLSLSYNNTYAATNWFGTSGIGFNCRRTAANTWTFSTDTGNNGGGLIDGDIGGPLRFFVRSTSGGSVATLTDAQMLATERMRITGAGNVGIATKSPTATLHVSGNVTAQAIDVAGVNVAPTIVAAFAAANAEVIGVAAFGQANTAYSSAVSKTGNTMTGNLVMSGANIAFTTATDSGIYWGGTGLSFIRSPAANTIVFGTSGAEDMRIDASGNVGIGTTLPTFKFVVAQSTTDGAWISGGVGANSNFGLGGYAGASDGAFNINYDRSSGHISFQGGSRDTLSTRIRIDGLGRVSVGTLPPVSKLTIEDGITPASNAPTYRGSVVIATNGGTTGGSGGIEFHAAASGAGYGFRIANPDELAGSVPLVFQSRASSSAWSERMRITQEGRVGVGTTSPTATLHISGNVTAQAIDVAGVNVAPTIVAAFDSANTKVSSVNGTSGQIYSSGTSTPTLNLISTGVSATTYGGSTNVPVITVDQFGRLTAASNIAVQGMDYAYVNTSVGAAFNRANTANITADAAFGKANGAVQTGWTTITANGTSITPASNADTLTFRTTGNVSIVGVSANDNIIFDLTTTGVTAAVYGNATIIPVMTVDSRGRVSAVTNTELALRSTSNYQINSLGVGTAASGTTGEIRATNNITAYYSDKRLKKNIKIIENALEKLKLISGISFQANDDAAKYGYTDVKTQIGVIAQEIEQVLPEIVVPAPFDIGKNPDGSEYSISGENYKTVQYEKLIPLLIQAIKELQKKVEKLENTEKSK